MVMESFEDSNCPSMSDSFSMYERYMKSFNVRENFYNQDSASTRSSISRESSNGENIDLSVVVPQHGLTRDTVCDSQIYDVEKYSDSKDKSLFLVTSSHTDKSDLADAPVSDECFGVKPVFISSIMENSNNAVDSVPLFDVRNENVFKLPITELSFNGTLKHVQKLKPIVDPITAFSNSLNYDAESRSREEKSDLPPLNTEKSNDSKKSRQTESSADSQYDDNIQKDTDIDSISKWNEQSYSSLEASFDCGVRSPDVFSDGEYCDQEPEQEQFWAFLQDVQKYEKKKVKIIQKNLQGVLPPPSVTTLKSDVTEMLKKYYTHLPQFNTSINIDDSSRTPTRKVSFIQIPEICNSLLKVTEEDETIGTFGIEKKEIVRFNNTNVESEKITVSDGDLSKSESSLSINDKSIDLKLCSETDVKESMWPDVLKCRHHDVYYNLTSQSENYALLLQKYAERFIGAETDTSVTIYSGGKHSPTSASKRKAMRLKMAQAKSPGRRLSHLARRRQAFCSAATIADKANASTKMVLIDKNYFPHRKLINSDRCVKARRTPGKKTPRKTPGSKTPKAGGSSKKKAMRRLLMDDKLSKSQPSRETLKRALFISPESRKAMPTASSMSVPNPVMKSRRSLFSSPVRQAETKSMDGTSCDQFLKRKREEDEEVESNRKKMARSLSFGGASLERPLLDLQRRASEMLSSNNSTQLNELHKKKLLWAVSEALRVHGWRMSSPGFREKASLLAKLVRRLLTLPQHAAKLASPKLSTSDTLLKLARQYVFAIIQGRTVDGCFQDEQIKLAKESARPSGYISAAAYQQLTAQVKENCTERVQLEPKSASKNVLQDKMLNVDSNSNSGSTIVFEKVACRSSSMPSFEEAKMKAKRQITFDNVDFPER